MNALNQMIQEVQDVAEAKGKTTFTLSNGVVRSHMAEAKKKFDTAIGVLEVIVSQRSAQNTMTSMTAKCFTTNFALNGKRIAKAKLQAEMQ